jgi:hypothetical protein
VPRAISFIAKSNGEVIRVLERMALYRRDRDEFPVHRWQRQESATYLVASGEGHRCTAMIIPVPARNPSMRWRPAFSGQSQPALPASQTPTAGAASGGNVTENVQPATAAGSGGVGCRRSRNSPALSGWRSRNSPP